MPRQAPRASAAQSTAPSTARPTAPSTASSSASTSPGGHPGNGALTANGSAAGWASQLRLPMSLGLQTLMMALHAGEELQRAQLDCWHLALRHHEQAHRRLLASEDAAEMASVQADLLRFDTANFTHLSQRCMDTGVHLNTNLARLTAEALDGSRHHLMRSAFESFQTGLRTGIRPLDEIFNSPLLRELALKPRGTSSATPPGTGV